MNDIRLLGLFVFLFAACREADAFSVEKAESEKWATLYRDASSEEIELELETLRLALAQEVDPFYEAYFQSGQYHDLGTLPHGAPFAIDPATSELSQYRFLPDGRVAKIVLPEGEFPAQYELNRQIDWLIGFRAILPRQ